LLSQYNYSTCSSIIILLACIIVAEFLQSNHYQPLLIIIVGYCRLLAIAHYYLLYDSRSTCLRRTITDCLVTRTAQLLPSRAYFTCFILNSFRLQKLQRVRQTSNNLYFKSESAQHLAYIFHCGTPALGYDK
jgi:hypothetical protein